MIHHTNIAHKNTKFHLNKYDGSSKKIVVTNFTIATTSAKLTLIKTQI